MAWDDDLTGVHYEISASNDRRIGVLAGPGTGKTSYGLLRRVARLIETGACKPNEILLLTFTRTAANDLVDNLADLGTPGADSVRASTVHAFCFATLQREGVLAIIGRNPRTLLEHERDLMLRDLEGDFGDIRARRKLLHAFEAGWARRASDHPGLALSEEDKSFEAQALAWLRHHRAMLIGEVVPIAFDYLKNNPQADERSAYKHVIVDEYQDLNRLEQELIELLVGPEASLCVAGDDDQSIYSLKHAYPEGVLLFVDDEQTESKEITECGRCPAPILEVANSLMDAAPGRAKRPLTCSQPNPGTLSIVQWADLDEEIQGLASVIAHDVAQEIRDPGDFLVLVHRREVGYRLREALVERGVEAHSFFQENALRRSKEGQASLALLHLLVAKADRPSLRVWLGLGDASGRASAYARLRKAASDQNFSEWEVLTAIASGTIKVNVKALVDRWNHLKKRLDELKDLAVDELVEELFPEGDQDLSLLREVALTLVEDAESPQDLFDGMVKALTQPEVPQSPDYVRVMSLHKSKGLTSPVVVVATTVDGIIPTIDRGEPEAEQEEDFNEQRRLFYVAITRSKDELIISSPWAMHSRDAYPMTVAVERTYRKSDDIYCRVLATPYLKELGSSQPAAERGDLWLKKRTGGS